MNQFSEPENSDEITREQMELLHSLLFRGVNFLARLQDRMEDLHFPQNDPLLIRVKKAYEASWELSRFVRSESIHMGLGKPKRK